jgi:hypothetical protein
LCSLKDKLENSAHQGHLNNHHFKHQTKVLREQLERFAKKIKELRKVPSHYSRSIRFF